MSPTNSKNESDEMLKLKFLNLRKKCPKRCRRKKENNSPTFDPKKCYFKMSVCSPSKGVVARDLYRMRVVFIKKGVLARKSRIILDFAQ